MNSVQGLGYAAWVSALETIVVDTAWPLLLALAFLLGLMLGLTAAATRYCTLGAVADWATLGETTRLRAWVVSMGIALLGVALLEVAGLIDLDQTRVGYRDAPLAWGRHVLGGLAFGIGMVLAGGCTTRALVSLGGGNLRGLYVYTLVGLAAAALLYWPPLHTAVDSFGRATALDLPSGRQDLGHVLAPFGLDASYVRLALALLLGGLIGGWVVRAAGRSRRRGWREIAGGVLIGGLVTGAWWLTGSDWGGAAMEAQRYAQTVPPGLGTQSFTFVGPAAELLRWLRQSFAPQALGFGVTTVLGVVAGSLLWHRVRGQTRLQGFVDRADLLRHSLGALLMGAGGVLAMGCTLGQGVSGVSTLALGSLLSLASMILGAFLTLRVIYYRTLFPDATTRTLVHALLTDLHLLPASRHPLRFED